MSTKRVILANSSRLLREMLHRVINKADNLEVVQDIPDQEDLSSAIARLNPEWVVASLPYKEGDQSWIDTCMAQYPNVRFVLFSGGNKSIKMKWQTSYEEDLTNMSLKDFIRVLEKDLQHT